MLTCGALEHTRVEDDGVTVPGFRMPSLARPLLLLVLSTLEWEF